MGAGFHWKTNLLNKVIDGSDGVSSTLWGTDPQAAAEPLQLLQHASGTVRQLDVHISPLTIILAHNLILNKPLQ